MTNFLNKIMYKMLTKIPAKIPVTAEGLSPTEERDAYTKMHDTVTQCNKDIKRLHDDINQLHALLENSTRCLESAYGYIDRGITPKTDFTTRGFNDLMYEYRTAIYRAKRGVVA